MLAVHTVEANLITAAMPLQQGTTYYGNRAERVASYIKEKILSNELTDPLPSSRVWCRELDVGRPTLLNALKILEQEGLVRTSARGPKITSGWERKKMASQVARATPRRAKANGIQPAMAARLLYYGKSYEELHRGSQFLLALSWTLRNHGIRLVLGRSNTVRLKAIASHASNHGELFFLHSFPVPYQRLFARQKKPAVIVGYAGHDVRLPSVTPDFRNAARHATLRLLRRGFSHVVLINLATHEEGITKSFKLACKEWERQPVLSEVVRVWSDLESQRFAIKRLAARTKEPCGFIVFSPVSVGMVATALLQKGISILDQAEIIAIGHSVEDIAVSVPVRLYGFPAYRFAKAVLGICLRYFETGSLPTMQKIIDLDPPKDF